MSYSWLDVNSFLASVIEKIKWHSFATLYIQQIDLSFRIHNSCMGSEYMMLSKLYT